MTLVERLTAALLREILNGGGLARARRRRRPAPEPDKLIWPAEFASYEEWSAWCRQDVEDERSELFGAQRDADLAAAEFEARFEVDPPADCLDCAHVHGGRAYGICLAPGCDCIAVRRAA